MNNIFKNIKERNKKTDNKYQTDLDRNLHLDYTLQSSKCSVSIEVLKSELSVPSAPKGDNSVLSRKEYFLVINPQTC